MTLSLRQPLRLGDLELEVLEYLWASGEGSAKSVHARMQDTRDNTLNTVQSTLDRLYKKGILERRKIAHSFHYKCRYSRTELLTLKLGDLAHELSRGETQALLAAFVEFTARLDASKIAELENMIAVHREKSARGGQ